MAFVFRLESVLAHRKRVEDERQVAFAGAQRSVAEERAALQRLEDDRSASEELLRTGHRTLDAETLRFTYAHLEFVVRAIEGRRIRLTAAQAEADRAREDLVAAARETKVLDTLKTRKREAYDHERALVEQRESDDANARRASRTNRARTAP
jgi:flagellar export protein FliJ